MDATKCRDCNKPHFLNDEDAGSEQEIQRLCSSCYAKEINNDRYYVFVKKWGEYEQLSVPFSTEKEAIKHKEMSPFRADEELIIFKEIIH